MEFCTHTVSRLSVLGFLPTLEIVDAIGLASRTWREIVNSEVLWHFLCTRDHVSGNVGTDINEMAAQHCWQHTFLSGSATDGSHYDRDVYYIPPPPDQAPTWFRLYARNVCPHLTQADVDCAAARWNLHFKRNAVNARCGCLGCSTIDVLVCCKCDLLRCGRSKQQHALQHFNDSGHTPAVNLRALDVWCYRCDRFLGETGIVEAATVRSLRRALLARDLLSQHRQGWLDDLSDDYMGADFPAHLTAPTA